jgi:hypothetical protein
MDGFPDSWITPVDRFTTVFQVMLPLCMVFLSVLAAGCPGTVPARPGAPPVQSLLPHPPPEGSIELVFFHPVPGCDSCERVSLLANETVNEYFSPERAAGKITFRDINLNKPENSDIAHRYGAYTESLWIGEYNATGFHATEIVDIWYYAYNREEYMNYLRGVLERKLAGTD